MKYVDIAEKKIYVCKDFAKQLWKANYDQCGINIGGIPKIPQFEFSNETEFLNHQNIKPPFFSDYTVVTTSSENCLTTGSGMKMAISAVSVLIVFLVQGILL